MVNGGLTGKLVTYFSEVQILRFSLWQAVVGSIFLLLVLWLQGPMLLVAIGLLLTISTLSAVGATSFSLAMQVNGKVAGSASALLGFFSLLLGGVMAPLVGINGSYDAMPMGILILVAEVCALLSYIFFVQNND